MLGGRGRLQHPPPYFCQTGFGPRSLRLPDHRVPLFQALYWSIRSEKLEWAV